MRDCAGTLGGIGDRTGTLGRMRDPAGTLPPMRDGAGTLETGCVTPTAPSTQSGDRAGTLRIAP